MVSFYSNTVSLSPDSNSEDNTKVNLCSSDDDILLHISIRCQEGVIVYNSCDADASWGREERIVSDLHDIFDQTDARIDVVILDNHFQIRIDNRITYDYKKRIMKDVQRVSYLANDVHTSVFANYLDVLVSKLAAPNYQEAYFPFSAASLAKESEENPFDYIIIGSGMGGGVLATDLLEKNKRIGSSISYFSTKRLARSRWNFSAVKTEQPKRILVIERGNLLFNTHSLNMPRPTSRGTYGQMNDFFYNQFKQDWNTTERSHEHWKGGPVYCLGGRSTVWGLFAPRISNDTFTIQFPRQVQTDLTDTYLRKAEETMNLSYPHTTQLHRALIDSLNVREVGSTLPTTQWEWGRVASEFRNEQNFDFAQGAYSTVDRLLEAAMDDQGKGPFKILLNTSAMRLSPERKADSMKKADHVVVRDASGLEHRIRTNHVVLSAGAVETPTILLRSIQPNGTSITDAFGEKFANQFGHVTDHFIFHVTLPFYYKDEKTKAAVGGMKLQTDIQFTDLDRTTALANISLDASSFLPRRHVPDSELPQFTITYILPSALCVNNHITLPDGEPLLDITHGKDGYLELKKGVLKAFAVDVMKKVAKTLNVQFVEHKSKSDGYTPLKKISVDTITLKELGLGEVAHELGSIPMPEGDSKDGLVDVNLKMKYGWSNVYVCDLSVFPYSPAANPSLSLAALSLRLSDHLVPPSETRYQPIVIYNVTQQTLWVVMTNSNPQAASFNPESKTGAVEISSGKSATWKREQKETIFIFGIEPDVTVSDLLPDSYETQAVEPGITALISDVPPPATGVKLLLDRGS